MATAGLNSCVKSLQTPPPLTCTHTHTHTPSQARGARTLLDTGWRSLLLSCPSQARATFALPKAGRNIEKFPGFRRR